MQPKPTYEELMSESKALADQNKDFVQYHEIGLSKAGRPIAMLVITDPKIDNTKKPVFLLSGGTDGNEEVGRASVMYFAKQILKPEYAEHLKRQVLLIVPVTNPDGTILDLPDHQGNGSGIGASKTYVQNQEPLTPEGRVMRKLVDQWIPDAHIDFHGLAGGGMGDSMYLYPTVNNKWSIPILYDVANQMEKEGVKAGFPQDGRPRLWWEPRFNLPGWLARNHSTFCMVMEGTENYYPIEDSAKAGFVRLLKFLEMGEKTQYFQLHPNYPCDLISGGYMGALLSYGETYEERRKSRRDMSQMIMEGVNWFGRRHCDHNWAATIELPLEQHVKTLPLGLTFRMTLDKRADVQEVFWHDHKLEDSLWSMESVDAGIVITAKIPESPKKGKNEFSVKYNSPFKRHVDANKS